jgi:hypothetical protein
MYALFHELSQEKNLHCDDSTLFETAKDTMTRVERICALQMSEWASKAARSGLSADVSEENLCRLCEHASTMRDHRNEDPG